MRILLSKLINSIEAYSPKNSKAKLTALYSVLNPETNSDSLSARSKGVRCLSLNLIINHSTPKGKTITEKDLYFNWLKAYLLINIIYEIIMKDITTSLEIIWAMARNEPRTEYLELEDQPDIKTSITFNAIPQNINNHDKLNSIPVNQ